MRILHFLNSLNIGGAEKLLVDFIESLEEEQAQEVYVCLMNESYNDAFLKRIQTKLGNRVLLIGKKEGSKNPLYIKKLLQYITNNEIEILHVHNASTRNYAFIVKLLKSKIKIILTVHHIRYKSHRIKGLERLVSHYIAVSEAVYNTLVDQVGDQSKISLIYNGINVATYNLKKTPHNRYNICCIGRIEPETKGQDILIHAINILGKYKKDIHCYFVGETGSYKGVPCTEKLDYLQGLVEGYGIEEMVSFVGGVVDIPEFLKKIDLLVLPSRHEGFGLVIVEAMAAKVAVIASNIDGPREIIKDNQYASLFETENVFDLADKIIDCIGRDTRERRCQAYEYVANTFDIHKMAYHYIKLYEGI
jgi:glycosyltransferase involved in cell wall biosynthesis